MNNENNKIDVYKMLEELRKELSLTIQDFCFEMNWPSVSYYDAIKSGLKRSDGIKKPTNPTINKIFIGINYAIKNFDTWFEKKELITKIIIKYLIN